MSEYEVQNAPYILYYLREDHYIGIKLEDYQMRHFEELVLLKRAPVNQLNI